MHESSCRLKFIISQRKNHCIINEEENLVHAFGYSHFMLKKVQLFISQTLNYQIFAANEM